MCTPLNDLTVDELAQLLRKGYKAEQSPEEKLNEYYYDTKGRCHKLGSSTYDQLQGRLEGVMATLNILGIKVEGIN